MKTRFFFAFVMLISGLFVAQQPVLAVSSTTVNFTLNTGGTVGSIGVDAIYNGAGGGGEYDKMVRWSADGRLWNFDRTAGSPTFGWRTSQSNGITVNGSASVMRLEIYPHPPTNCSGVNENDACYWATYDPWQGNFGGVQIQVDSTMGSSWLNVGQIDLPQLGVNGAFRLQGNILSHDAVADNRIEIDLFQIDCSWHETCVHPPTNSRGVSIGAFASTKNKGNAWTGGIAYAGHYVIYIRDMLTGRHLHGIVDISPTDIPTIDLDAVCFGIPICTFDQGSSATASGGFHAVNPTRILDTRNGTGISNGPIRIGDGSQSSTNPIFRADDRANHDLQVTGVAGIPTSGVSAVLLNVTAVQPPTSGYITVGPRPAGTGDVFNDQFTYGAWPNASNLNTQPGQTVPNLVLARVGAGGKIRLYNFNYPTHMVADVAGWFDTSALTSTSRGSAFYGVPPQRLLDTRNGIGEASAVSEGKFAPLDSRTFTVADIAGVPNNVESVVLNITAVSPTGTGWVTAYPDNTTQPDASNLNLNPGSDRSNLAVVKVGSNGKIRLFVAEAGTHLIFDVFGYFKTTTGAEGKTTTINPTRIFDTRNGIGTTKARMNAGQTRTVQVAGAFGIPSNATAVYLNVTSVNASAWGWLAVWPTALPMPTSSNVNFPGGSIVPNMAIVQLGTNGTLQIYNDPGVSGTTSSDVLIDVLGYVS
jgi:hypothetical protein